VKFSYKHIIISTVLFVTTLNAQVFKDSKAKISNIEFELIGNKLIINYDLTNSNGDERFDIEVNIISANNGIKYPAKTFSGALKNQSAGRNKLIEWYIDKDISYLDDGIYVLLEAIHLNPVKVPYTSKIKASIQSTVFPGWGSARTTTNNYNLAKGVVAYSLIAMSIKLNYDAYTFYEKYKNSEVSTSRDKYYNKAENSYRNSFYSAGGATIIWLSEYLWIWLSTNKTEAPGIKEKRFELDYNAYLNTPLIKLSYKF